MHQNILNIYILKQLNIYFKINYKKELINLYIYIYTQGIPKTKES